MGIDKIEEQVTKIESADFIGETILEVIEKEAVAYLGPIAATICKEKFAEAGEIKNQTELLQLLEGIADLMGDNNKEAEFKNRVIEKLK